MSKLGNMLYSGYDKISYKILGSYSDEESSREIFDERQATVNMMYDLFFNKNCKPGIEITDKPKQLKKIKN